MSESVECIVIGAGVVGLAIARELANKGIETIVVEQHSVIGSETSSRNSEVIHAGIYYPYASLKARLCVMGKSLLYDYCEHKKISHSRCGKLIVATSEKQLSILKNIQSTAKANGVNDLILLSQSQSLAMEPQLRALGALHSPSTGIIDSHRFMLSLQGDLESAGGVVAFNSPILSGEYKNAEMSLNIGGEQVMSLTARFVINCAGLSAQHIARQFSGLALANIPPLHYAKGNYYALQCKAPFSRLIYPVPEEAGLGIHYTMDLAGAGRFGPDVEWIDNIDYALTDKSAEHFYAQISRYWPNIKQGDLMPAYSGIRPKLSGQGEPAKDFVIQGYADHGIKGLVNLFGIESPGLTASLAIAQYVAALLLVDNSPA